MEHSTVSNGNWLTSREGNFPRPDTIALLGSMGSYKHFSPGQAFGWKAVVVMVKADWAEYAHTMAYRSWAHHEHPCFLCDAKGGPGGNLHTYEGWSTTGMPFAPKTARVYDDACRAQEQTRTITSLLVLHDFLGRLEFDKQIWL